MGTQCTTISILSCVSAASDVYTVLGLQWVVPRTIGISGHHRRAITLVPIVGSSFQVEFRSDPHSQGAPISRSGVFNCLTGIRLLLSTGQQHKHLEERRVAFLAPLGCRTARHSPTCFLPLEKLLLGQWGHKGHYIVHDCLSASLPPGAYRQHGSERRRPST